MKNSRRIIVVLGTYRSGTSVLTKSLETLGVRLSEHSEITFHDFNKKGDWEDLRFSSFNGEALKALQLSEQRSRVLLPLNDQEVSFLCDREFFKQASQLLLERLADAGPFGIKDPKFCLLLPFWKKVFQACDVSVSFVIALRNPLNVVASIQAADRILGKYDPEKSFWIWISYLLTSLQETEDYERVLVDYDELIRCPEYQLERIASACKLKSQEESMQRYCRSFLDVALRHFHVGENNTLKNSFCRDFAIEIYETLFRAAKDEINVEDLKISFKKWRESFFEAQSLLILAEKKEYEIEQLRETIREREQTILGLSQAANQQLQTMRSFYNTAHQQNLQMASLLFKH